MTATLTIRDQSLRPGSADHVFELEFPTESVTIRELIRERVYQEAEDYNRTARATASPEPLCGTINRKSNYSPL